MEKDSDKSIMKDVNGRSQKIKYSKQAILDYINGNDLQFYVYNEKKDEYVKSSKVDYLERDFNFMLDALRVSKDKNLLNLCSNKLLKDPLFIYEVMDIFEKDKLFCIGLSNNYIAQTSKSSKYEIDAINIALKAQEINNDRYIEEFVVTGVYLNCGYYAIKNHIKNQLKQLDTNIKFCFRVIQELQPFNEPYKEYMAKHMVDDIFESIDNLEYYVKTRFKSTKYIGSIGSRQYILDLIRGTDEDLADYVEFHQHLITNKVNELNKIMIEWKEEESEIEEDVHQIIEAYCEQHMEISIDTCLKFIAKELDMPSLLEHTFEAMNENLIIMGYETLDLNDVNTDAVNEIEKQKLLFRLKRGILAYIQNNKKRKPVEKITHIDNLRLIKKCEQKTDI